MASLINTMFVLVYPSLPAAAPPPIAIAAQPAQCSMKSLVLLDEQALDKTDDLDFCRAEIISSIPMAAAQMSFRLSSSDDGCTVDYQPDQTRRHTFNGLHDFDYRHSRARDAPFKPGRTGKGSSSWQLRQFAEATLGSGSLRKAVKLPEGEDINEWLAVNSEPLFPKLQCT